MAYEVIKRVKGRAYRYRVESYRDPVTRRVRGKWTYLGRVEGEGSLGPDRIKRPTSRERLLGAVHRLLEDHDVAALSSAMIANEAGLAYGTFYRHFRDLSHVVRDAMTRATPDTVADHFDGPVADAGRERERLTAWVRATVGRALASQGVHRAWHVASNTDAAVVAERQRTFEAGVEKLARYLERLLDVGLAEGTQQFSAYAIVSLVGAAAREAAIDGTFAEAKYHGIISIVLELAGLERAS